MSKQRGERDLSKLSEAKLLDAFGRVTLRLFKAKSQNDPKAEHYAQRAERLYDELDRRGQPPIEVAQQLMSNSRFSARIRKVIT